MRVLFVPYTSAPSHIIPLLALDKMLAGTRVETAFLAPRRSHALLRNLGARVLDDHHNGFMTGVRTEVLAYRKFGPDVVVDDTSVSTGYSTALTGVPRVTILRTGMFPGGVPGNPHHKHSIHLISGDVRAFPDPTVLGLPPLRTPLDLFRADIKLVPGVESVEVLPGSLRGDPSYRFCGPLLMDDMMVGRFGRPDLGVAEMDSFRDFDALRAFFEANAGRRVVYMTFGTAAQAGQPVFECLRHLLERDIAVVSSVSCEGLGASHPETFFYRPYLPMHFVCSNADLMIHQCGSGTYHYPILHNVPTLTVGTKCYDREDVARRLEELGVSTHLPAPDECQDFVASFKRAVGAYFADGGRLHAERKQRLASLGEEVRRTSSAFDFKTVLEDAARLGGVSVRERRVAARGRVAGSPAVG